VDALAEATGEEVRDLVLSGKVPKQDTIRLAATAREDPEQAKATVEKITSDVAAEVGLSERTGRQRVARFRPGHCRQDRTVGEHLSRRDEILTALGVRAESGDNRFTDRGESDSPLPKTTSDVAAEVGLSERTAQQRKQVAGRKPLTVMPAGANMVSNVT